MCLGEVKAGEAEVGEVMAWGIRECGVGGKAVMGEWRRIMDCWKEKSRRKWKTGVGEVDMMGRWCWQLRSSKCIYSKSQKLNGK